MITINREMISRQSLEIKEVRACFAQGSAIQNVLVHPCFSPAWWLWRSVHTRSHLELGRKSLQRQWYFVLRRGRVGRCQACEKQEAVCICKIGKPFILDDNQPLKTRPLKSVAGFVFVVQNHAILAPQIGGQGHDFETLRSHHTDVCRRSRHCRSCGLDCARRNLDSPDPLGVDHGDRVSRPGGGLPVQRGLRVSLVYRRRLAQHARLEQVNPQSPVQHGGGLCHEGQAS